MKLSIIISDFKQSERIASMLDPIVERYRNSPIQRYFEIIVWDDADGDDEGFRKLSLAASRSGGMFHTVMGGRNVGCGGVRNRAVSEAKGEYVWLVDGDDDIAPDAIERIIAEIDRSHRLCYAVDYVSIKDGQRELVKYSESDRLKLWEIGITCWCKVVRRDKFVPFREAMCEDNDWWMKECLELYTDDDAPYGTIPGGPCLTYYSLADGSFTKALDRIKKCRGYDQVVDLMMASKLSMSVMSAVFGMLSSLAKVSEDPRFSAMPDDFKAALSFVFRYFFSSMVKVGAQ